MTRDYKVVNSFELYVLENLLFIRISFTTIHMIIVTKINSFNI